MKKKTKLGGLLVVTLLLLAGCGLLGFSQITNNPKTFRKEINKAVNYDQTTLILINKDCADCKRDQDQIINGVKKLRKQHHHVLVYDVKKLSRKDRTYLIDNVPGADYKNGLVTPTFIDLRSSENHHFLKANRVLRDKSTSDQIKIFFESIGEK